MPRTTKRHGWESETALAACVVAWLKRNEWEVFQEVDAPSGVADIIARKGSVLWAIEAKLNFSFHLFEQAVRWLPHAWDVSVAIPDYGGKRMPEGWHFGIQLARNYGIGILKCDSKINSIAVQPAHTRKTTVPVEQHCKYLNSRLYEQQKTYSEAGGAGARRWTPFKKTSENLHAFIAANPGCTLDDCANGVTHHYKTKISFKNSVLGLIPKGVFKFRAKFEKGQYRLYPV